MKSSSHSNSMRQPGNLRHVMEGNGDSVLFSAKSLVSRTVHGAHSKGPANIC